MESASAKICRGIGRIFKGGFHDPPAKLRGRGYTTCACAYWFESGVSAGKLEKLYVSIIYFIIIETAVSANRYGAPAGVRECH